MPTVTIGVYLNAENYERYLKQKTEVNKKVKAFIEKAIKGA